MTKEKFMSYRRVQESGKWNMLSSQAMEDTGLGFDDYLDIIKNYGKYFNMYIAKKSIN